MLVDSEFLIGRKQAWGCQVGKSNVISRCSINFCRVTGMVSRETSILTTTGRGGEAHSKTIPNNSTTNPPRFTWNNRNYKITKGKLKIAVWETYLSISNYSHDQCFTWNLNWSFKLSYTSKHQNPTNTSKQIAPIPTPPRFTWNTKPQQPIGERQRTLNAISCNSTIRSCFTWNHSSIFRTHQTYVSRETSGSYQTLGKHNTK